MIKSAGFILLSLISLFRIDAYERKVQTLFVEKDINFNKAWVSELGNDRDAIKVLISYIEKSDTGKALIKKARKKSREYGDSLENLISIGDGSLTDTTLVRRFSPNNPWEVDYESKSSIILNRHLSVYNVILDLAHELTHFTRRHAFNPYETTFSLADFVRSTIEGRGGEVEAYMIECQVFLDLFSKNEGIESKCDQIIDDKTQKISRYKAQREFYKLGVFKKGFQEALKRHHLADESFKSLSSDQAEFISSAYGVPYPLAAIQEYETIMEKVCLNDAKRLSLYRQSAVERSPASSTRLSHSYREMVHSHETRCKSFL